MRKVKRLIKGGFTYLLQTSILKKNPLFDSEYYLSHNKDVADAHISPIKHFLRYGAKEGRNPSDKFDVAYYLKAYPDVKASGVNPLYHYIRFGAAEGRTPKAPTVSLPLSDSLSSAVLSLCNYSATLIFDHNLGGGAWKYVYNSLINVSASNQNVKTLIVRFVPTDKSYAVEVRSNTKVIEKVLYNESCDFFADISKIKYSTIVVNNLFSWPSTQKVLSWIAEYKKANPFVEVEFKGHDYYCICPSFTLQDYNHRYCGIKSDETECNDCIKSLGAQHCFVDEDNSEKFSVSHWRDMWNKFFVNIVDVFEVFSPSSQKIFLKAYPNISLKMKLVPHKIMSFDCYNVAVLGHCSTYKGSEVVRKFCKYLDENQIENMQVYLFGWNVEGISSPHLKEMGAYERHDLPEKLKRAKIDMVFIPSTCPETFCYTAGESIALGYPTACFDLGGQADQVREAENGVILYSEEPDYLYTTFKSVCGNITDLQTDIVPTNSSTQTRTVILQDKTSRDFLKWMYQQRDDKSHFVAEAKDSIKMDNKMPKVIAAYLPQYHDFPENIRWFGKGFSEWTNTSQTMPQFIGHRQPHVPIDVGYYNLNNTDAMHRQAELAKKYGISGFCVYYYWFSGTKLMDQPLKRILEDKDLDFPFFLFWANDDWTMCWGNGATRETLYKSELCPDDAAKFMDDVLPYMRDSRYIKIGNKPVLLIYKIALVSKANYLGFVKKIQEIARHNGFDGLYLLSPIEDFMNHADLEDVQKEYKLDALIEFHPIAGRKGWNCKQENFVDPSCRSICYDVDDFVQNRKYLLETKANVFTGLFPDWDNSPRRYNRGAWILQSTPENYKMWLSDLIRWTRDHNKPDEQFIFVNAWNEWAEGAHLEPDSYYGYAYLQKTREALEESGHSRIDS